MVNNKVNDARHTYDDGNHLIQTTLPSGRVITYSRDGVRRIAGIDTTLNNQAQSIVSNITYRGDSQMLSCTYGNGLNDIRNYDLQGRLLSQRLFEPTADDTLDQRAYIYDKNSNITAININGTETIYDRGYGYDRLDRLTSDGVGEDDPMTYGYDQNDNRQTRKQGTGADSIDELMDYIEGSNRIDQQSTLKRGTAQLPTIPDRNMVYSDTGRLYQLIETGTLKAEYIYNDLGQRTKKTLYQADGITVDTTTIYHYDQMGHLITETTETGNLIKDYVWSNQMMPVAQIDAVIPDKHVPEKAGTGIQSIETITYLYTDHLMTNRLATGQSKTIIWRWEGEAFGNTQAQELSGVSVNLRFPRQYYDSEPNLHYNWHRYYDPALGRYITSDPIGLQGGMNTYLYVNANPIINVDPQGLFFDDGGKAGGGLGGSIPIVGPIGVSLGFSIELRVCCDEDNMKVNELYRVTRVGVSVGASAGLSGSGRGNVSVSVGGLPSCINPESGEEVKPPFSVIQIRGPIFGVTIDLIQGRGDIGGGAQAGLSGAVDIYNVRTLLHSRRTGESCECED